MTWTVAAIVTPSHLGLAHCMATSFLSHHPDGEVVVLVDGPPPAPEVFADLAVTTLGTSDLDIPDLEPMRSRYSAFELCNALKPFLLTHLVTELDRERALYLDSDLYVVDSLVPDAFAVLDRASILLTPHLCTIPPPGPDFVTRDLAVLLRGTLNGGFVGVRRGADAARFLAWWSERVASAGYNRVERGMYVDQRWLDLVPSFDLDLVISKHPGLNVAYWNLDERTITSRDGRWFSNAEPLRFVHFSGFDVEQPTALTRHPSRFDLGNRPDVAGVADEYRNALRASTDHVAWATGVTIPATSARGRRPGRVPSRSVHHSSTTDNGTGSPPDVSVVIPVHNGAPTLGAAVHSALTQEAVTVEVIVVDDGSSDDPASVLPPDTRITLLTTRHGGVSRARNHGLSTARARMVIFLDADDTIADPLRARDQLAMLDQRPDLGIIHSGWEVCEDGRPVAARTPWTRLPNLDLDQWVEYPVVLPSAMAFRRDGLNDVGGFDESLRQVEDLDLVLRMLLRGWTAAWLERVTTRYHRHAASASADIDAQARAIAAILDRLFSDPATPDSVAARQRAIRYSLHVWLASRYHRVGRMSDMAAQLAASSVWYDGPVAPLALDWVQRFVDARTDAGDPPLDVQMLTAEPAWQSLIRSPAGALLERGVAVSGRAAARRATPQATATPPPTPDLWAPALEVRELPPPALDCSRAWSRSYGRHRSGWTAALEALRPLHVAGGFLVDGFVEHTFQPTDQSPYRTPWIGFLHNPAELPAWYPIDQSATRLLADDRFRASLATCRGLFTLSTALRDWWAPRVDVPVEAVPFPTGTPLLRFTLDGFRQNPFPRLVQVGTWLRKLHAVHDVPVHGLQRTIVHQHELYIDELFAAERSALRLPVDKSLVETLPFLDDHAYDELLSCNLVFVELYAASANNAVLECLARGTPILVNPLPAVREYLGDDYPFYFSSRTEAASKAEDDELVAAAHHHLVNCRQAELLSGTCFVGAIAGSAIYRGLAEYATTR